MNGSIVKLEFCQITSVLSQTFVNNFFFVEAENLADFLSAVRLGVKKFFGRFEKAGQIRAEFLEFQHRPPLFQTNEFCQYLGSQSGLSYTRVKLGASSLIDFSLLKRNAKFQFNFEYLIFVSVVGK